nr:hypothetical protein [Tanacetum cinerariifolium]GEY86527.1 hypothetical protein [Tanacetum cinerariifolium]
MPTQGAPSGSVLNMDKLQVGVTGTIIVMLCRLWDVSTVTSRYLSTDLVVSNAWGNAIHYSAMANIAHNFIRLKEGRIYIVKNFVVQPNTEEYHIKKDDTFMLEFDEDTTEGRFNSEQAREPLISISPTKGTTRLGSHYREVWVISWLKRRLDRLYLLSSSSAKIFNDADIPTLKDLRTNNRIKKVGITQRVVGRSVRKASLESLEDGGVIPATNQ